jgi:SAM-dependent methyltransferase
VLTPPPRELDRLELLDRLDASPAEVAGTLGDIARLNRLGGTRALLRHVAPFLARYPSARPLRVLDVGTGGADVPLALVRWARRRGRDLRVVALDAQPAILRHAVRAAGGEPRVRVVAGDALESPIRPGSVDVAVCSLVLHHLPEPAVVALLGRLAELARLGFVVSDLHRGWLPWAAVWVVTRAISRNRLTRHDGPLSVRRAYTRAELARLAAHAGLPDVRWHRARPFRVVGVWARPETGAARAA